MKLKPVTDFIPLVRYLALWDLLQERTPDQSISHGEMPEWEEHINFVDNEPYLAWYLICEKRLVPRLWKKVGMIYLTKNREIGVQIFNRCRGHGYGTRAVKELMRKHPGKFYANINPKNQNSINFFKQFGARHIQNTYLLEGI